jgi:hypothetical protein
MLFPGQTKAFCDDYALITAMSGWIPTMFMRIAVPMIGGMVSSTLLTLIVIPAIYAVVKGLALRSQRLTPILQQP